MRILIVFAAFLLSGCWTGNSLYTAADARTALPPGRYRMVGDDGSPVIERVSIQADGMTRFESDDERPSVVGFAPLDRDGRKYAVWESREREGREPGDAGVYWLLERRVDGEFLLFMPDCRRTEEIARAVGATIERSPGILACHFPDRASLEEGLRRLHPDPAEAARLVRVGDG
jgi:hypothetical protein